MTRIIVAGATGWTGRAVVEAVLAAKDLTLVGAVSRSAAGRDVGEVLGRAPVGVPVTATVAEALAAGPADVLVDYTKPGAVKGHVLAAVAAGVAAVVGTSGLTAEDYAEIDAAARAQGVGVVASGNFALTAALLSHFSLIAAQHIANFEIIDYAKAAKPDAPSGTARELAERLGDVRQPDLGLPLDQVTGSREARGGTINGVQVHSVRLPSFAATVDALFTVGNSRLKITHDAGADASIYADGTLLAARRVKDVTGVVRGLDTLLFGG